MKIVFFAFLILATLFIRFLHRENNKKSDALKKKMQERKEAVKNIKAIEESSYKNHKISSLLITMLEEFRFHDNVNPKLTDEELITIEKQLNVSLPLSYKLFLKYFGDGGYWIYSNPTDSIRNWSWLSDYRKELDKTIELDKKAINVDSLLCLMAEDSNGGAWCWLTTEGTEDGEWPLAYYSPTDKKLHYKVENFTEWLKILVDSKGEVIRELDLNDTLGLG